MAVIAGRLAALHGGFMAENWRVSSGTRFATQYPSEAEGDLIAIEPGQR
jgi:hypothetical protein